MEIIRLVTGAALRSLFAPTPSEPEVTITWRGRSQTTRHEIVRPVSRYESLGEYDRMMDRIMQPVSRDGLTIKELAAQLTREGYRTQKPEGLQLDFRCVSSLSRRGANRRS